MFEIARAIAKRCCSPPEIKLDFTACIFVNSNNFNNCKTLFSLWFVGKNKIDSRMFSSTVWYKSNLKSWFTIEKSLNPGTKSCAALGNFLESKKSVPSSGVNKPAAIFKRVDFPAPLLPTKPIISAGNNFRFTFFKIDLSKE